MLPTDDDPSVGKITKKNKCFYAHGSIPKQKEKEEEIQTKTHKIKIQLQILTKQNYKLSQEKIANRLICNF